MSKILLVIPTLKQGGAERVMSELANEWASLGNDVHLVLLAKSVPFYELHDRVQVYNLGFYNKGKINKLIAEASTLLKLRRLIKLSNPDFVLSFMEKYNILTILASLGTSVPVFVSDRSNPNKKISKQIEFLRSILYKRAAGIIAQTKLAKRILEMSTGNDNIKVISNPLRRVNFNSKTLKENIIINVGRLVPEKGHEYLIKAFAGVDSGWHLVILGEGPLRNKLRSIAHSYGVEDRLIMPGSVSNVDDWLCKSSMFAFSSISEGFPNALAEGMAAGLPCISFDCDAGPSDIINDGVNGYLVPSKNIEMLSEKMNFLVENPNLRNLIGNEAGKISERLSVDKVAKMYYEFCLQSKNIVN